MKSKIAKSLLVITLVALSIGKVGTYALWTADVDMENNTIATGTLDMKIFYDCHTGTGHAEGSDDEETYNGTDNSGASRVLSLVTEEGVLVECPDASDVPGLGEWDAMHYGTVAINDDGLLEDGTMGYGDAGDVFNKENGTYGDWLSSNGWWDALSSGWDHTNIFPTWQTYANTSGTIAADTAVIVAGEGDITTIGNSGTIPFSTVDMYFEYETEGDANEVYEPLDGAYPGGDMIDPLDDAGWALAGKLYNVAGASDDIGGVVYVQVDWVDSTGAVIANIYTGNLTGAAAAAHTDIRGAVPLDADEVMYVRVNMEMADVGNGYQGKFVDYSVRFDGTQ
ncbi:MAG: hypothetical protein ABFQ62_03190 [Patescibacteria group bacterium]